MRQGILFSLVTALTALVLVSSAGSAQERASCPNGFTAYAIPQTEADLQQFPRIVAGLAADPAPYTAEELIALAAVDRRERRRHLLPQGDLEPPRFQHQGLGVLLRGAGQRLSRRVGVDCRDERGAGG